MDVIVGVDIGGTGVRAGTVDPEGRVGPLVRRPLEDRSPAAVVAAVRGALAEIPGIARVGVGMPGFVQQAVVIASPNFPEFLDEPIGARLEQALGVPVCVENDANLAALGAWLLQGRRDLVLLTLGTGVGGGVVSAGRLLRGSGGTGGELGHIYAGGVAPCGCGGIGCLESWCGTWGLQRLAAERGHEIADGVALTAAAEDEAWAREVLAEAGEALGRGLVTLVNVFNPEVVMITGGLALARPLLAPSAEGWLRRYGIGPSVDRVVVEWEGRADHFAIVGAAHAARSGDV